MEEKGNLHFFLKKIYIHTQKHIFLSSTVKNRHMTVFDIYLKGSIVSIQLGECTSDIHYYPFFF